MILDIRKALDALAKSASLRGLTGALSANPGTPISPLKERRDFGPNPGNLRMFAYVPSSAAESCPLMVVLHGCGQTAAGYDYGTGWSTLADRYGFALLMPEQQRANNANGCFNWFEPGDTRRDGGEAASIRAMVEKMLREDGMDPRRVYITGLSAGGAMTSVMLACYPDVFAGGAIIAGLPFGAAGNLQQAYQSMFQSPPRAACEWGDSVRNASLHHKGPWPRVSVWHGNADKTVIPSNAREIIKQWTNVHGLSTTPSFEAVVDGYPRKVWLDEAGEELIESYCIPHMAHGTPLATGDADTECGSSGPFLLDVGISSSFHIAKFFGLTQLGAQSVVSSSDAATATPARLRVSMADASSRSPILHGEILEPETEKPRASRSRPAPLDVGGIIAKALEAAGLMRR